MTTQIGQLTYDTVWLLNRFYQADTGERQLPEGGFVYDDPEDPKVLAKATKNVLAKIGSRDKIDPEADRDQILYEVTTSMYKKFDRVVQLLEAALGIGMYKEHAAIYAGIDKATVSNWRRQGKAVESALTSGYITYDELNALEKWDLEVARRLAKAEIRSLYENVKYVQGDKDWKARMTMMERRYPDEYGRRARVDQQVKVSGTVEHKHEIRSDDFTEAAKLLEGFDQDFIEGDFEEQQDEGS